MNYLFPLLSCLLFFACGDKAAPQATQPPLTETAPLRDIEAISELNLFQQIESSAKLLRTKAEEKTDYPLAEKLISDSKRYAVKFQKSEKTPRILFRAAEVARSIGNTEEAITLFRQIYTQFPSHEFGVKALFMEGSTFEDDLKDKEKAKRAYQRVIDQYPKDQLAEQAQQLLKVIDKSPEELIKEFQQKKNKE